MCHGHFWRGIPDRCIIYIMLVVALTGNIGMGKTLVLKEFAGQGAFVINWWTGRGPLTRKRSLTSFLRTMR
jgi:hypothetical protein